MGFFFLFSPLKLTLRTESGAVMQQTCPTWPDTLITTAINAHGRTARTHRDRHTHVHSRNTVSQWVSEAYRSVKKCSSEKNRM